MKITEVNITPIKPSNGLIAFASIVIDDCLYLGSIAIYKRLNTNGYRITYPTKKIANSNINIFHPIRNHLNQKIELAILDKVKNLF